MTHRTRTMTAAAAGAGGQLVTAAVAGLVADVEARELSGIVVPFGQAGRTSAGLLTFGAGALSWSDPANVVLLREHDQRDAVGHAVELVEQPAGLWARFALDSSAEADRSLREAAEGSRTGFSIGAELDDATMDALWDFDRDPRQPVAASGQLREVSHVSVPAFDGARIAAADRQLVVASWSTTPPPNTSAAGAGTTATEETHMTEAQRRRLAHLLAQASLTSEEQTERDQLAATATAAGITVTPQLDTPAVVPAVAGGAVVTGSPSTYRFDGTDSLVRDAYMARMDGDSEAGERMRRFNAELRDGNPASVHAFATAAATRDDVDGAGTDAPAQFVQQAPRTNLMRDVVDTKRPLISRLTTVPISNAQPFGIPKVGEFDGVGDHTEGTPHRPAGTLTLSGDTVQPTASSGAWEVSRELVDAMNPAIDRIAMRAMLRDYRRFTEGKLVALIAARGAQAGGTIGNIATPLALRGAMFDFVNDDDEPADLVAVSKQLLKTLGMDTDNQDRPQLPFVGPSNAQGTVKAGHTGVAIDGVDITRAVRLAADTGVIARSEGILWAESPVLQFRYDEVLGPGVIKLALWAYSGAALLDTADVQVIQSGAVA